MPFAMTMGGATYYLAYDQVGSLRLVVDSGGSIVKRIEYDSFGNILSDSNAGFSIPFGFAGGLHDRETGLIRFGYRDYLPEIGKWTAKDPIDFAGGDSNLYGYVANDPVNWVDIVGLNGWKAVSWARLQIGKTNYQYWDPHAEVRGRSGKYLGGRFSPKCNAFVSDALASGKDAPGRDPNGVIPSAGAWDNPNSNIPGYHALLSGTPPEAGDIVADAVNGISHVGIYYPLSDGSHGTISASTKTEKIEHNDWGFRAENTPTIWRSNNDLIDP